VSAAPVDPPLGQVHRLWPRPVNTPPGERPDAA
jgi:hypothetical protein